jgi:hypothetical protein
MITSGEVNDDFGSSHEQFQESYDEFRSSQ